MPSGELKLICFYSVDFPVLNSVFSVNISSTGNLDCEALAKQVVNATTSTGYFFKDTVICDSNFASVTTYNML